MTRSRRAVVALAASGLLALTLASSCGRSPSQPRSVSPAPETTSSTGTTGTAEGTPSAGATVTTMAPVRPDAPWPRIRLVKAFTGFDQPLYLTSAPRWDGREGPDDLYVVEKTGRIRRIRDGRTEKTPVLDISGSVSDGAEQGLLGLAFVPGDPRRFYVDYTDRAGDTRIVRYTVREDGRADPSGTTILTVDQPYANHNGGQVEFGPDGMLYIGMGDGGSGGDPHGNGQDLGVLLGKILRIDPERRGGPRRAYAVPDDNPFVGRAGARPEIWAYGLRNPWRFSFSELTGHLYIADVGQNAWEEIDAEPIGRGGRDYGWNLWEGDHPYPEGASRSRSGFTFPVAEHAHPEWGSITGGYVYDGTAVGGLRGVYVYGDYVGGQIWGLRRTTAGWQDRELLTTDLGIASFGLANGDLYVLDLGGDVYRVVED